MMSFDPGKSTGWAEWDVRGRLVDHGILLIDDFFEFLRYVERGPFVYESFTLDHRARKQVGSQVEASQAIGAIRLRAKQIGAAVWPQRTESRDMGYLHAGLKRAGQHKDSHDLDAVAHGVWFWESQGVVPDVSLIQ